MYSVRKTTKWHGNANLHILFVNLIITSLLIWKYDSNYLIIFISSSTLHLIIETGLTLTGIRKGDVYLYGKKLPKVAEIILRSTVEGPGFCVPAFFIADQFIAGNLKLGLLLAVVIVGAASFYLGWRDRRDLKSLGENEPPIISRRAMTKPRAVMLLALINTVCISMVFLIPKPYQTHAFAYILGYALLVMMFYFINYNLGVRYIELYDEKKEIFTKPGPMMQAAGLTYDSAYEMALLVSPAYWITFYLGFFHFTF